MHPGGNGFGSNAVVLTPQVDEYFRPHDRHNYHVWIPNRFCIWDTMLTQTNITGNNLKYYKLQILESKHDPKVYIVWFRWGRVGEPGQNKVTECGADSDKAKLLFCEKFYYKTGNTWKNRDNFVEKPRKYSYIPMQYSLTGNKLYN